MSKRLENKYDLQVIKEYEEAKANGTLKLYTHEEVWVTLIKEKSTVDLRSEKVKEEDWEW